MTNPDPSEIDRASAAARELLETLREAARVWRQLPTAETMQALAETSRGFFELWQQLRREWEQPRPPLIDPADVRLARELTEELRKLTDLAVKAGIGLPLPKRLGSG
jgi:hypothetical protein